MKSIARQNSAGAKTHPCLTPEVVMNGMERHPAKRTPRKQITSYTFHFLRGHLCDSTAFLFTQVLIN